MFCNITEIKVVINNAMDMVGWIASLSSGSDASNR
jgi:hypothetical protein